MTRNGNPDFDYLVFNLMHDIVKLQKNINMRDSVVKLLDFLNPALNEFQQLAI